MQKIPNTTLYNSLEYVGKYFPNPINIYYDQEVEEPYTLDIKDVANALFNDETPLLKHKVNVIIEKYRNFVMINDTMYPPYLQDLLDMYREITLSQIEVHHCNQMLYIASALQGKFGRICIAFGQLIAVGIHVCVHKRRGLLTIINNTCESK